MAVWIACLDTFPGGQSSSAKGMWAYIRLSPHQLTLT